MSAKKNPQRYVSDGELQAMKRGISREMFESFEVVWMSVMRDKFGWGADRLAEIMQDTHAIGEALIDDKISTDSMQADLRELRRVRIPDAYFIRRPMGRGETYWTAADLALAERRVSIADLRQVLLDEAHIVLQRPVPREKEIEKTC